MFGCLVYDEQTGEGIGIMPSKPQIGHTLRGNVNQSASVVGVGWMSLVDSYLAEAVSSMIWKAQTRIPVLESY